MSRIKQKNISLDYAQTKSFFDARIERYSEDYPYMAVTYQDSEPELGIRRDLHEKTLITPLLELNEKSRVLDIGCGVGRWLDSLAGIVGGYVGIDFSAPLLEIAKKRSAAGPGQCDISFQQSAVQDLFASRNFIMQEKYSHCLCCGVLTYVNNEDIRVFIEHLPDSMEDASKIYLRESVGVDYKITLKDFYSEELKDTYNAIYRTAAEYRELFQPLLKRGYQCVRDESLFDGNLNKRAETTQHFFLFARAL